MKVANCLAVECIATVSWPPTSGVLFPPHADIDHLLQVHPLQPQLQLLLKLQYVTLLVWKILDVSSVVMLVVSIQRTADRLAFWNDPVTYTAVHFIFEYGPLYRLIVDR